MSDSEDAVSLPTPPNVLSDRSAPPGSARAAAQLLRYAYQSNVLPEPICNDSPTPRDRTCESRHAAFPYIGCYGPCSSLAVVVRPHLSRAGGDTAGVLVPAGAIPRGLNPTFIFYITLPTPSPPISTA